MAREVSGTLLIQALFEERHTARGIGSDTGRQPHNFTISRKFETGTGSGLVDRIYSLASGSTDSTGTTIDISGSLADVIDTGLTVVFVKIKLLIIKNTTASGGGNLIVFGSTHPIGFINGSTDKNVIPPANGALIIDFGDDGLAVTAATTDEIKIAASTGTVTYQVLVVGTSA